MNKVGDGGRMMIGPVAMGTGVSMGSGVGSSGPDKVGIGVTNSGATVGMAVNGVGMPSA